MSKSRRRPVAKPAARPVISPVMIGIVAALAIIVVAGLVWLNLPSSNAFELDRFPAKGSPTAPVTMVDFSDYG